LKRLSFIYYFYIVLLWNNCFAIVYRIHLIN